MIYTGMLYLKNKLAFLLFLFLLMVKSVYGFEVTIQVFDAKRQPVSDARVIIAETKEFKFTDKEGKAVFDIPQPGFYQVRVVLPDGNVLQPSVQVLGKGQLIPLYTSEPKPERTPREQIVSDQGVIVVGRRELPPSSVYTVRLDQIKRLPGQFGEAIRGIENLPGVVAPPFGSGEVALRGSNPDSNSFYVDDLPIAFAYHLGGLSSVIQNEFIQSIDVYTGSYPAKYGDATGGVIAIFTPDEVERTNGVASISVWATNLLLQVPYQNSSYVVLGGKVSYLDQTLRPLLPKTITLVPKYQDLQIKIKHQLSNTQSLFFYVIGSRDSFVARIKEKPFENPLKEPPPDLIGLRGAVDRDFITTAIRHRFQPSSFFQNETTLIYYTRRVYIDASIGNISAKFTRTDGYGALRNETRLGLIENLLNFEFGVELRNLIYNNKGEFPRPKDPLNPNPDPYKIDPPDYEKVPVNDSFFSPFSVAYGILVFKNRWLEFRPGIRYEYFSLNKQAVLVPRGSFAIRLTENLKLIGGGGIYHRVPSPNEYSPTSGNPNLRFEKASHTSGGFEYQWRDWLFRVEGFKQYYDDLVIQDPYITTPIKINQDPIRKYEEPILFNAPLYFSNRGDGRSYGAEVFIRFDPPRSKGLYGWLSYTHSVSKRRDHLRRLTEDEKKQVISANERRLWQYYDNSKLISADFDRRHLVRLIIGWKINPTYQIGIRWRYQTSPPYTVVVGDDGGKNKNNGRPLFQPKLSEETNTFRSKPYHSLDIRFDKFVNYEWGYGNIFVELINVYLRQNIGGFAFNRALPFTPINPRPAPEFGTLEITQGKRKIRIPLFNLGFEVKF
ncbi:MAG: TonB-dependent receptor [Leptospiraceae bacterium]|nr:TonB-dependent receptor [Leptospiraceae bacterium]